MLLFILYGNNQVKSHLKYTIQHTHTNTEWYDEPGINLVLTWYWCCCTSSCSAVILVYANFVIKSFLSHPASPDTIDIVANKTRTDDEGVATGSGIGYIPVYKETSYIAHGITPAHCHLQIILVLY